MTKYEIAFAIADLERKIESTQDWLKHHGVVSSSKIKEKKNLLKSYKEQLTRLTSL